MMVVGALLLTLAPSLLVRSDSIPQQPGAEYVFHISVDGLMPHATHGPHLRNFQRLRDEGAWTDNARIDYHISQTLQTHTSQLTGLPVEEHGVWNENGYRMDPPVQNIFDLVANAGGKTCMFAAKEKFVFYERSFHVDAVEYDKDGWALTDALAEEMTGGAPCTYALVAFWDPDRAGHRYDGEGDEYHEAVARVDGYLGQIFDLIDNDTTGRLRGRTAIILTTDHGFATTKHKNFASLRNYQIPFYVWGPPGVGVKAGADLYLLNPTTRKNPWDFRPDNDARPQPIRCHDAGPVAADLLGIKPSSGRFSRQDLAVGSPETTTGGDSNNGGSPTMGGGDSSDNSGNDNALTIMNGGDCEKGQCGECEGDCDHEVDCQAGLMCFERDGYEAVPGCSGQGKYEKDYCVVPPEGEPLLEYVGDCSPSNTCGECQGDCDEHEDCQEGYVCFERDDYDPVPGCSGYGKGDKDYCVKDTSSQEDDGDGDNGDGASRPSCYWRDWDRCPEGGNDWCDNNGKYFCVTTCKGMWDPHGCDASRRRPSCYWDDYDHCPKGQYQDWCDKAEANCVGDCEGRWDPQGCADDSD